MRVKARVRTLAGRALAESMEVKTMVHLARRLFGSYDLHERTGFPSAVPIPNRTAAKQIVEDAAASGLFLDFVATLVEVERLGMGGRRYRFAQLQAIVKEICETGYRFDATARAFVEDIDVRTTRNWGVLREGETYIMAFLGIDVVGNSRLVREHGQARMSELYDSLRRIVSTVAERRNGRLWGWEGDGGIAAFTSEEQNQRATLAGIEILNEVFIYNLIDCPIEDGLHVRVTVHNGPCQYSTSGSELKVDTIKRIWEIDSRYGIPDTLVVTGSVYPSVERVVTERFRALDVADDQTFYTYAVRFAD